MLPADTDRAAADSKNGCHCRGQEEEEEVSLVREIGVQCGSEVTEKGALLRGAVAAEAARRVVGSKNLVRWSGKD